MEEGAHDVLHEQCDVALLLHNQSNHNQVCGGPQAQALHILVLFHDGVLYYGQRWMVLLNDELVHELVHEWDHGLVHE